MNRRNFVTTAGMAGVAPVLATASTSQAPSANAQYFELRHYSYATRSSAHRQKVSDYLKDAAIPAWNRHGIEDVGVFSVVYGPNAPSLYVLLPHPNLDSVASLRARLAADEAFQKAGASFLDAELMNPAFVRVESSLMKAFEGMPRIAVPSGAATNEARIFELRIYESHSEPSAIRKVEMFNKGEIDIFHKTGLTPVFFGESIIGSLLPNLTYMLTFKDLNDRDESWGKFIQHPDWKKMSSDPYYADTVSNITSIILRPMPFSQI